MVEVSQEAINNIVQFIFMLQMGMIVLIFTVIGIVVAWTVWWRVLTPKDVRSIRKAARSGKPLMVTASDDGCVDFEAAETSENGVYCHGEPRKKGRAWIGHFPRSHNTQDFDAKVKAAVAQMTGKNSSELTEKEKEEATAKVVQAAELMNDLAKRKLTMRHAKTPIWFAYRGKAILSSLFNIVAIEALEQLKDKNIMADLIAFKSLFPIAWDQSQQQQNEIDAEKTGMLEANKNNPMIKMIWFVLAIGMVIGLAIVLAVIMYFF